MVFLLEGLLAVHLRPYFLSELGFFWLFFLQEVESFSVGGHGGERCVPLVCPFQVGVSYEPFLLSPQSSRMGGLGRESCIGILHMPLKQIDF